VGLDNNVVMWSVVPEIVMELLAGDNVWKDIVLIPVLCPITLRYVHADYRGDVMHNRHPELWLSIHGVWWSIL